MFMKIPFYVIRSPWEVLCWISESYEKLKNDQVSFVSF